jgi:FAD/FMN-containing dehydrogenase
MKANALGATGPSTVQNVWFMNGAITEDFAEESAAFSREGAAIFWEGVAQWDNPEDDNRFVAWADGAGDALLPEMRANGYVNLTTDRGPEWLRGLYGGAEKYRRLVAAKQQWDPQNLLRFNKNIKP